jgi:hypothetical protein
LPYYSRPRCLQTIGEIVNENVWFSLALDVFGPMPGCQRLPFDHHNLLGMVRAQRSEVIVA